MSSELPSAIPLLALLALWLACGPFLKRERQAHRAAISALVLVFGARYLIWRYTGALESDGESYSLVDDLWTYFVLAVETMAFIEIGIFVAMMAKTKNRSHEADLYESKPQRTPSVDVFIPTYNEGIEIVEKTIIGAMAIDYPNFKVWVLDDGRRQWLKDFCEERKIGYITRPDNKHAKAGNINHALRLTSGEYFAIFDADFVPAKRFLKRTIGFLNWNEDVAIVQTPQHFFNNDPIQSNLYLHKAWPDEQRLFFDHICPSRDAWDAAFCCGSCALLRRKAIEEIGGIPTDSITEDQLATLALLGKGYKTVYLKEKLSQGLSPESLAGYFVQRSRWCRGGIQLLFVKDGPLRSKNLSLIHRILFTPYGWLLLPLTRLTLLLIPIIYLWTGVSPLRNADMPSLVYYQFPLLALLIFERSWFTPGSYTPIISSSIGLFSMFRLLPVALSSLIKPFGTPFRVTPKGSSSNKSGVESFTLWTSLGLLSLTSGGIVINLIPELRVLDNADFFPYAVVWAMLDIVMLAICALICFDAPRKRKEERFAINEETVIAGRKAIIADMSPGGCKISHGAGARIVDRGQRIEIPIPGLSLPLLAEVRNSNANEFMCQFMDVAPRQKEELILKIFSGNYDNEVYNAAPASKLIAPLMKRLLGNEMK